MNSKITLRALVFVIEFALMAYSLRYYEIIHNIISPCNEKKQINLKLVFHLTNIGYYLTIITFALKVLCYYFDYNFPVSYLLNIFIIEMGITLGFWALFFKNKKLVLDLAREEKPWYIHMINESPKHLIPFTILFIEILLAGFPRITWSNTMFSMGFITIYWGISEIYTILTGAPLYTVLLYFNILYRYLMYYSVILLSILVYLSIQYLIIFSGSIKNYNNKLSN